MICYHKLVDYVLQTLWIQKKQFLSFLIVIPAVMALQLVAVFNASDDWYSLIYSLNYEFFYVPFFLIMFIAHLLFNHCWLVLRMVQKRSHLVLYLCIYCFVLALIFTVVIFLSAFLLSWEHMGYIPLNGHSHFGEFFESMIIFLLVMMIEGLLSLLINEWLRHYVLSIGIVIALTILDRYTIHLIGFCFVIGYKLTFFYTLAVLLSTVIVLGILMQFFLVRKDFL
ncbi:hypothetical protein ABWW58_07940 [Sporolactobacillus sp. STCC-11]|uniref:hypothetical protein n=1 Tax=Sporolactobacillus caesalpiniae TaxID=3230362 RepID=UPI003396A039